MPTGYTKGVADGSVVKLHDFALLCARAMTPLLPLRDEPMSTRLPHELTADTSSYDRQIEAAEAILAKLPTLSAREMEQRAEAAHLEALESYNAYVQNCAIECARYQIMLRQVEEWKISSVLQPLREFMRNQLNMSNIDYMSGIRAPILLSGENWKATARSAAEKDLARAQENRQQQVDRVTVANRWLAALWDALPEE
jgi:hypothetical protein